MNPLLDLYEILIHVREDRDRNYIIETIKLKMERYCKEHQDKQINNDYIMSNMEHFLKKTERKEKHNEY